MPSYTNLEVAKMMITAAVLDDWDDVRSCARRVADADADVIVSVFEVLTLFTVGFVKAIAAQVDQDPQEYLQGALASVDAILVPGAV